MFYVGLAWYILSILWLVYCFWMTGASHGDPKAAMQYRHRFLGALGMFVLSTICMSFYSLWFGLPLALLILFVSAIVIYDKWRWR